MNDKFEAGSEGQKIQELYANYREMDKRNEDGIAPIKADWSQNMAIKI